MLTDTFCIYMCVLFCAPAHAFSSVQEAERSREEAENANKHMNDLEIKLSDLERLVQQELFRSKVSRACWQLRIYLPGNTVLNSVKRRLASSSCDAKTAEILKLKSFGE